MDLTFHPSAGWTLRPAGPADFNGISQVFLTCLSEFPWRSAPRRELMQMENALLSGECFVVTEPRAGVVGFMIMDAVSGYISHLFVDADWRFCGIGSSLLQVARSVTSEPLKLDVDDQNTDALRAYQALGWTEVINAQKNARGQRRLISP